MRLVDILDKPLIKVNMVATERDEALEELVDVLARAGRVSDHKGCVEALLAREAQQTTGVGSGVAIPHAKHPSIEKLTLALGISKDGIEFDAIDDRPVNTVFLLMAPVNDPGSNVQALAEIARLVRIPGFLNKIAQAKSAEDVLAIIKAEE